MRLEPARCCALCCSGKGSADFTARSVLCACLSTAGWSPRPAGAGLSQVPRTGTNHPPLPAPRARTQLASAVCGGSAWKRLRRSSRGSAHSRGWKSWRRRPGASPPRRPGPGDLPPFSRTPVAPHLLRGPHSTLDDRHPRPGEGCVGRSRLPLTPVTWLKDGSSSWLVTSYLTFPLIFISI